PWMRDHLFGEMQALAGSLEPNHLLDDGFKRIVEGRKGGGGRSLIAALGTTEQRAIIDRVTGVMSLLEGHADVVMDGVGPQVIPTVETIRAKFTVPGPGRGFDITL